MEGSVNRWHPVFGFIEMNDLDWFARGFRLFQHGGEEAVIRHNEKLVAQLRGDRSASGANAGVYHGDVDGASGEVGHGAPKGDGAGADILGRDFMGDVDDLRVGRDTVDDPFHRSGKAIEVAKVSGDSDQFHGGKFT